MGLIRRLHGMRRTSLLEWSDPVVASVPDGAMCTLCYARTDLMPRIGAGVVFWLCRDPGSCEGRPRKQ